MALTTDLESQPLLKGTKKISKQRRLYDKKLEELLAFYAEDDEAIANEATSHDEHVRKSDQILSKIVLAINVGLLFAKATATYLTNGSSLSIISTLLDSIVDITSGIAIWYATYAIMKTDIFKYPRGRQNLEAISIIFIGLVMGMANFYIVIESIAAVIIHKETPEITVSSLLIIAGTIVTKGFLWIICIRKDSPSSKVLAIDQRNDVLTNLVAILGAFLSQIWTSYADPAAAILISGYVVYSWILVILDEIPQLVGVQCSGTEISRVARILIQHSDKIRCLDTLLVYHTGNKVRVEAHVVLSPNMLSREVHDEIVEPLQKKLQRLEFVDRAFIHPDYECDGYD